MKTRTHERIYPEQRYTTMSPSRGDATSRAAVRDLSASGIGLVIAGRIEAGMGSSIRVLDGCPRYARHARVVRIATERCSETQRCEDTVVHTLGCRWIADADRNSPTIRGRSHGPVAA
ncbi:MAG: hypothetical protein AAGH64_06145 [Planctomycetota bacterium]